MVELYPEDPRELTSLANQVDLVHNLQVATHAHYEVLYGAPPGGGNVNEEE